MKIIKFGVDYMKPLVIERFKPKPAPSEQRAIIRIDDEASKILRAWQEATAQPIKVLASEFIKYAGSLAVIKECDNQSLQNLLEKIVENAKE